MALVKQKVLRAFGLSDPGHPILLFAHRMRRVLLQTDSQIKNDYLHGQTEPKMQIGGGWHRLDGWLNTDIETIPDVMRMDASGVFPFSDSTFQYIYTEHMIEHVPYCHGMRMLSECYRIMRPGGVIRVITPDLATITGLYSEQLSGIQKRYISWFCETFVPEHGSASAVAAINAHFRLWGHQFIYDEATLSAALCAAGFQSVDRYRLGNSDHVALRNLENVERYPDELLDFESVALEAYK